MKKKLFELKKFIKDAGLPIFFWIMILLWFVETRYFNVSDMGKMMSDIIILLSLLFAAMSALYAASKNSLNEKLLKYSEICRRELKFRRCIVLLAICGVMLRYFYILYTDWGVRQHDVGAAGNSGGHIAYIWELYSNNFRLPEGDPRGRWQFYQPPLHHMTEAVFEKIISGNNFDSEKLQIPTFIYSCISMKIMYDFFVEMGLRGKYLIYSFAVVCFHPTFIIMAGSVNNDMLSSMFIFALVLYTIRWYKTPDTAHIIPIAVCMGLGMMSKLSVGLAAPAIALVFIIKFVQKIIKKDVKQLIQQYMLFLFIACPLGLWWSIRNLIKYDMPLNYVPLLGKNANAWQYVGDRSFLERFEFSIRQFDNVFMEWERDATEFNPFTGLLKTSVFGEFDMLEYNPDITISVKLLFYSNLMLVLISFFSMIFVIFSRKDGQNIIVKIFLSAIYLTFFGNYINFCMRYPFTCTMNIRYAAVLPMLGIYFTGEMLRRIGKNYSRTAGFLKMLTIADTILFCASSAYVYTALAI